MIYVTCRLTVKNRDQLRNGSVIEYGLPLLFYPRLVRLRLGLDTWADVGDGIFRGRPSVREADVGGGGKCPTFMHVNADAVIIVACH